MIQASYSVVVVSLSAAAGSWKMTNKEEQVC